MSDTRRKLGFVLVTVGVLAVGVAALEYWRSTHTGIKLTTVDRRPITGINPEPVEGVAGDAPRIKVPDTPPPGRTLHVSSAFRQSGDGSFEKPWNDLQAALCALEPGDRLLIMSGGYPGPFAVDENCRDGTAEKPIEVYVADDALMGNLMSGETVQKEVLRLARSHWRIAGIEIRPQRTLAGVVIGPDVHHVTIENAHIYSGLGTGIVIEPGSEDITVRESHLHQLGTLEGRSKGQEVGTGAGVRIAPGTRRIAVLDTKMHNILGPPVEVTPPEQYTADPTLPPATDVTIDDEKFAGEQRKWY